jgi:DEAD/DEAH box helicase domain-containing protein
MAVWSGRGYPAGGIELRSGTAGEVRISLGDDTPVGTVEVGRAPELVHPGAVYLHQGAAYQVLELDLADRLAVVEPTRGDTYTMARTATDITICSVDAERAVGRARLYLGAVDIVSQVTGFQRRSTATHDVVCSETLDLPPSVLHTRAFWYVIGEVELLAAGLSPDRWPGTLHAAEHAGIGLLPLFTICDRWDVGGVSTALQAQTQAPTIVIYDGYPGGVGIAELGFEAAGSHLAATLELVAACPCSDGCPSCVQSPKCGNWNEPLDKDGAVHLLRHLLEPA